MILRLLRAAFEWLRRWRYGKPQWGIVKGTTPHGWSCEARVKKLWNDSLLVDWVRFSNSDPAVDVDVAPALCWNPKTREVTWLETREPVEGATEIVEDFSLKGRINRLYESIGQPGPYPAPSE